MPQLEVWSRLPVGIREHLVERMHQRNISLEDLNRLRLWIESKPDVPEGLWYKDFGSFKLCGEGKNPKTFLLPGQTGNGRKL
jgi:hypothetical protein